jgi:DNA repair protein SbcC/Rad50
MINKLTIHNFQSHRDSVLEFSDGVNVIIGPTDNGKSAILRSLIWIITNKPSGDDFKSNWGGETIINVSDDNFAIERSKGITNSYTIIRKADLQGQLFTAFGTGVPEEVVKLLNIGEINIQYQLEGPFLLSASSGEVARYLNKIVNLDNIDTTLANIAKTYREEKNLLSNTKTNIEVHKANLAEYDWIDDAEKELVKLELLDSEIEDDRWERMALSEMLQDIISLSEEIKSFEPQVLVLPKIDTLLNLNEEIKQLKEEAFSLDDLLSLIHEDKDKIITLGNKAKQLSQIEESWNLHAEIIRDLIEYKIIDSLYNKITDMEMEVKALEKNYIKLNKEIEKIMPDVCPLCGQRVHFSTTGK